MGICIGCIDAKTNIHVLMLDTMFQHVLGIILDMMFQHLGTVQCALFYALMYAHFILLRNPRPHIFADQATRISVQNQL